MDNTIFFSNPKDLPQISIFHHKHHLLKISYQGKSASIKLKNEEDLVKLPMLIAQFLSKYGIETELTVSGEDDNA